MPAEHKPRDERDGPRYANYSLKAIVLKWMGKIIYSTDRLSPKGMGEIGCAERILFELLLAKTQRALGKKLAQESSVLQSYLPMPSWVQLAPVRPLPEGVASAATTGTAATVRRPPATGRANAKRSIRARSLKLKGLEGKGLLTGSDRAKEEDLEIGVLEDLGLLSKGSRRGV